MPGSEKSYEIVKIYFKVQLGSRAYEWRKVKLFGEPSKLVHVFTIARKIKT